MCSPVRYRRKHEEDRREQGKACVLKPGGHLGKTFRSLREADSLPPRFNYNAFLSYS